MVPRLISCTLFALLLGAGAGSAQGGDGKRTIGLVISDQRRGDFDVEVLNTATDSLFRTQRFRIMERERLERIIEEKGLQEFISALTSGDSSAGIEELEGVDLIGLVSYTFERLATGHNYFISVRLVAVSTGQIENIVNSRRDGLYPSSTMKQAGIYLFQNAREAYPPEEYIVELRGKRAVVGMGMGLGLKKGDVLEVIRQGNTILHPVSGKALPGQEIVIGTLKVTRVGPQISSCKVAKAKEPLQVGHRVRLKRKGQIGFRIFNRIKDWVNKLQ